MNRWYSTQGKNGDVVISSRIQTARNLAQVPFPNRMSDDMRKSVCKKIYAAVQNSDLAGEFDLIELPQLTDAKKISLAEKGIISPIMAQQTGYSAVLLSKDESVSIMLCEDDHIRMSVTVEGQNLEQAYEKSDKIDNIFIKNLHIAFDERLGFLTANPMNLGTGLKASIVLHIPAINARGMVSSLTNMVGKLGFSLKPLFGGKGDFFKLSNRISLGITEKSAIDNLNAICEQIIKQERVFRDELIKYDEFEDRIFRAMGTLKMARKLSTDEFYSLMSLVRLGISMGSFDESYEKIGTMLYTLGTATIISDVENGITPEEADKLRAQYVREQL
ncbi:MAG: ATP--guanido phosphotransferase [Clostridiales bacterium]|nr:ATP--guanido phosphotransferase [Clostridiales bacterium]